MASILDRYGIKEVADVTFYEIGDNGLPTNPVLFLDTLKVSTIEQTGEQAEARGGKGNPPLIIWDYGKEINVTLEDALFSAKSMAIMFGNGAVKEIAPEDESDVAGKKLIMKTEQFIATAVGDPKTQACGWNSKFTAPDGQVVDKIHPTFFTEDGAKTESVDAGKVYFCTYDLPVDGTVIEISANTFPGTYYVTGDTYSRNEINGKDEFFQFIIPKAKVQSENTITLEAEGDPSVFNMSLRVMRAADGSMMKLVKYNLEDLTSTTEAATVDLVHNHELSGATQAVAKKVAVGENIKTATGVTKVEAIGGLTGVTISEGKYAFASAGSGTVIGLNGTDDILETFKVTVIDPPAGG